MVWTKAERPPSGRVTKRHCRLANKGSDCFEVVQIESRQIRNDRIVAGDGNDTCIAWKHELFPIRCTVHFNFGVMTRLESLDNDEINRRHDREKFNKRILRIGPQFMHQGKPLPRRNENLFGSSLPIRK